MDIEELLKPVEIPEPFQPIKERIDAAHKQYMDTLRSGMHEALGLIDRVARPK